jgi:hypothetical protein
VTEYVPEAAAVAPVIVGFCCAEVKPFGPVQLNAAPAIALVVRFRSSPIQIGLFDPAVGARGMGFTTTVVVAAGLVQPPTETVAE